jgi:hypothetical protein
MIELDGLKTGGNAWTFRRVGGIYQAQIKTVEDLKALSALDPKLWVALSCPVNDLEIDDKTLELLDYDEDGRVRIEEVITAVNWVLARLSDVDGLFKGSDLPLAAINTQDVEGQALLASAQQILANTGHAGATHITVAQSGNTSKIFGMSRFNGDGVISTEAVDEPEIKQLILEIIDCVGSSTDRSGEQGVDQAKLDQFTQELQAYDQWWSAGEAESDNKVFPLGESTPRAYRALIAVEKKLDDYFARCQLAAFDSRAQEPLNHDVGLYKQIAQDDFSTHSAEVERLPIARISSVVELPLITGINPEWNARFDAFLTSIIEPMKFGTPESLSLSEWGEVKARFNDYRKWRNAKPETGVEKLGISRARELLHGKILGKLASFLKEDLALAPKMKSVDAVEKLARYNRDLIKLLNNFVNFNDFYATDRSAIFQAGTLYLDGRECRLCLRVGDPAKHSALAGLSRAFVAYCECKRKDAKDKFYVAAVFSAGDSANLIVGRNGLFQDRKGALWDAQIVRLIENPISIREAFLMPYVRLGRFIGTQLEKWAVTRDKDIKTQMETGVQPGSVKASKSDKTGVFSGAGSTAGMLAAGGIALGAVGAGIASLFDTIKALQWWELPLILIAVMLMISFPSMLIAWLKLRKRTLAPLLDASGWAVNGRTLINAHLGRVLTMKASLPIGASSLLDNQPKVRTGLWLALGITVVAAAVGWAFMIL